MAEKQGQLFVPTPDGLYRPADSFVRPGLARADAPQTSKSAAESVGKLTGIVRLRVLEMIKLREERGATCDEIEQLCDLSHQTASARIRELAQGGHIRPAGTRPTRSGRAATVWVGKAVRV